MAVTVLTMVNLLGKSVDCSIALVASRNNLVVVKVIVFLFSLFTNNNLAPPTAAPAGDSEVWMLDK